MKKTGKKRILNFVLVTILLLLGLFCVGLLYLFFVPNSTLFGVTFISRNNKALSETYHYDDVQLVKLSANRFDIEICESPNNDIYVQTLDKSLGYTTVKNKNMIIKSELVNNVVTYTITEPTGALFKSSSYVKLFVPNQKIIDVKIVNNKSETIIEDSNVVVGNLSYTTKSGDIVFEKGKVKNKISLNLNKADCEFEREFQLEDANLDIKSTSGKVEAKRLNFNNVNILENKNAVIQINQCNSISQSNPSTGGKIEINKLNTASITAGDTNIIINEVAVGVNIDLKKSGYVKINSFLDNSNSETSSIITNSGDITISNCKSSIIVNTKDGNINISNAYRYCKATSTSGNITISYAEDAQSFDADGISRSAYIVTTTGKINLTGVEYLPILEIKQDGSATVNFTNVLGENEIIANEGNIGVVIDMNAKFNFKSTSNAGDVKVNFTQTEKTGGWTDKRIPKDENKDFISINNYNDTKNSLSITSTSGNIYVVDTNLA